MLRYASPSVGLMIIIFSLQVCAQPARARAPLGDVLNTPVRQFEVESNNIHEILLRVATDYQVPIGLEVAAKGTEGTTVIKVSVSNGNVRDIFDAIVEQDNRYEWAVIEGVVNFVPNKERDVFLHKLLDLRIRRFSLENDKSRFAIKRAIRNIPEIQSALSEEKVTYVVDTFFAGDHLLSSPDLSVVQNDVTLREILNRIIKNSDAHYWIVNRGDKVGNLIINF